MVVEAHFELQQESLGLPVVRGIPVLQAALEGSPVVLQAAELPGQRLAGGGHQNHLHQ